MMIRQRITLFPLTVLTAFLAVGTEAFVSTHRTFAASVTTRTADLPPLSMLPDAFSTVFLISTDDAEAAAMAAALGPLRTFFGGIAAVILLAAGFVFVNGTFLIPAATEQLQKDTQRLRPGLWEEYEAKLLEGESMGSRPDLLQELGDIMVPIIRKDFDVSAAKLDKKKKVSAVGDDAEDGVEPEKKE